MPLPEHITIILLVKNKITTDASCPTVLDVSMGTDEVYLKITFGRDG